MKLFLKKPASFVYFRSSQQKFYSKIMPPFRLGGSSPAWVPTSRKKEKFSVFLLIKIVFSPPVKNLKNIESKKVILTFILRRWSWSWCQRLRHQFLSRWLGSGSVTRWLNYFLNIVFIALNCLWLISSNLGNFHCFSLRLNYLHQSGQIYNCLFVS